MERSNEFRDVKANGGPLQRLKGSVGKYELPFKPIGVDDWEAMQVEELVPATHRGDEHSPK